MLIPATVIGTAIALTLSVIRGETWPSFPGWAGAIYIGLGPMAAGYTLWTYAMGEGRADRLIPLSYATPLISTVLLLLTGEPFTGQTLIGTALILLCSTGVLLNQWQFTRHHRTHTSSATRHDPHGRHGNDPASTTPATGHHK